MPGRHVLEYSSPLSGWIVTVFSVTVVNAPQIPVGVQGVNTASLSGLSEKRRYCLLWAIKLVVCSFIQKKRERQGGVGGRGRVRWDHVFCYYHHVLAGKKCLSAPGLVEWVTSLFLFNFSWESECAPLFSFSRTLKTVMSCGECHGDKAGRDHRDESVLPRLKILLLTHTSVCRSPAVRRTHSNSWATHANEESWKMQEFPH